MSNGLGKFSKIFHYSILNISYKRFYNYGFSDLFFHCYSEFYGTAIKEVLKNLSLCTRIFTASRKYFVVLK